MDVAEILKEWKSLCDELGVQKVNTMRSVGSSSSHTTGADNSPADNSPTRQSPRFQRTRDGDSTSPEVNARQDCGHYARFGEGAAHNLGRHAGVQLPRRQVAGGQADA